MGGPQPTITKTTGPKVTGTTASKRGRVADQVEMDSISEGRKIRARLEQNKQVVDVTAASLDPSLQNRAPIAITLEVAAFAMDWKNT